MVRSVGAKETIFLTIVVVPRRRRRAPARARSAPQDFSAARATAMSRMLTSVVPLGHVRLVSKTCLACTPHVQK
jgi:hypothetical protein